MNNSSNIAPHILAISLFLTTTWGVYLAYTLRDYVRTRREVTHRAGDRVKALRRFLVALCLWLICFAYVFRTLAVLIGLGDATIGVVTFFALVGTNVAGSLFAIVSLRYDE